MDKNLQVPNYSGVNIQIFNPAVNMPSAQGGVPQISAQTASGEHISAPMQNLPTIQNSAQPENTQPFAGSEQNVSPSPWATIPNGSVYTNNNQVNNNIQYPQQPQPQYMPYPQYPYPMPYPAYPAYPQNQEIQNNDEKKDAPQTKKKRVVVLTDDYIRSLENYLNNPNKDVRLQAAKTVVQRFEEDTSRYDDPALNALMNKMLQDPQQSIRNIALGLASSGVAQGNNYTVQILNNMKENPANKHDALFASEALLNIAAKTETIDVPIKQKVQTNGNKS